MHKLCNYKYPIIQVREQLKSKMIFINEAYEQEIHHDKKSYGVKPSEHEGYSGWLVQDFENRPEFMDKSISENLVDRSDIKKFI